MVTGVDDTMVSNGTSIAAAFFNHHIGSGENAVAKTFLARGREVGPIAALRRRSLRNYACNHLVAFAKFHRLAGAQPGLQPLSVPKLANVYARHTNIVPQIVT